MGNWLQILNFTRAIKKEKNNKIKLKRDDSKFERSNKWMERWRTHQAFSLRNSRTLPRSHNPTVGTTLAPFSFRGRSHTWYYYFLFLFLFFSLVYRLARFSIPRASKMGTHALSVVLHFRLFTCHALWKSVMRRRRDNHDNGRSTGLAGEFLLLL